MNMDINILNDAVDSYSAANFLGISIHTLAKKRTKSFNGNKIRFYKVGPKCLYLINDLIEYKKSTVTEIG